ncbi:hypothetical protein F9L16_17710 [Agarivorans sp. B2Z047]|uniref:hypothetical protein n=1 Tax=Agarivorans sp. B2Z047 TaxID=2652721 RepID=UPI00128C102A|nr:hypothetical protein [Agarivorans sp. B2Z047]MPW30825.1 hypothetical protein [Agarivorans sp. B2Z047]UQN40944.1 hypothetical protein LQZ07_14295 [Agarivorans sp. B2Z047]
MTISTAAVAINSTALFSPWQRAQLVKCLQVLALIVALVSTGVVAQDKSSTYQSVEPRNSYFALTMGSGITNVEGVDKEDKKQNHRSFDVRFGQYLKDSVRLDFVHANEGHPYNHHRDGFSTQLVYTPMLTKAARLELGSGPYFSFDTTRNAEGVELNEKGLGIVSTVALVYPINYIGAGAHIRGQWNNYLIPDRPTSNSFLVGFGIDIVNGSNQVKQGGNGFINEVWVSLANTKINHGGPETTVGYSAEGAHRFSNNYAVSLGWLDEGGDSGWTERRGIAAQLWRFIPLGNHLEGRFGAGPYFAQDKYEHTSAFDTKGVVTIGVNYYPHWRNAQSWFIGGSLTRVIDKKGYENDADIARLTIGYRI